MPHPFGRPCASACWVYALALVSVLAGCSEASKANRVYEHARAAYIRGDLAQAAQEAGEQAKRWEKSPDSPWFWKFRLLTAEVLTTQSRFPEAQALLAQAPPARPELEQLHARQLIDRATLEVNRHAGAAETVREARQIAKEPELLIRLDLVEGALALDRRDHSRAEQMFRAALDRATHEGNGYYQALALNNLSVSSKRLNRYEDSIAHALRALEIAKKAGALRSVALTEGNLGTSYAFLGDFEAALEHEKRAVEMNEAMGAKQLTMTYLGELGLTYDRADRTKEAIPQYGRAYALAMELGLKRDAERFAENLALALLKTKQWDDASRWNDSAWTLANETKAVVSLPFILRNRARIALGRGQLEEAERLCQELLKTHAEHPSIAWETHETLGEIHTAGKRNAEANRNFEDALRIIEGTRSDLLDPRFRITLLSRLITFYRDYVDALVAQGDDLRALRVAESSRARVLAERLGRDAKVERLPDAAGLRAFSKAANATVLAFWIAPQRSFAWLLTAGGVRRFDLPPSGELEAMVTAYRDTVEHTVADPLSAPAGRVLWDRLLGPIAAGIPKDARVIVIPDGPLHRLNLETLAAQTPAPHYWIEDVEVAVAPSISIAMSTPGEPLRDGTLLAIGAPDYTGAGYDPLPGAAAEVEQLRSRFTKAAVFTGAQASAPAYRAVGPGKFSVIHFAAHAEANVEKPLESAVVLSRSAEGPKLYARDVIDIPIHAELVTLSACKSAGARSYAGEGLMGFAWAFLHAGAKAVVAGLWDVRDDATGPLMAKFYEGIAARKETAAALRQAKLSMLHEGRFRKAYYWGAFQTYLASAY